MGNNDQKYKVSFEADFKGLVKNAQDASNKMEELFANAVKHGVKSKGLQGLAKEMEKLAKQEAEVRGKLEKKLEIQKKRAAVNLVEERIKGEWRIADLAKQLEKESNEDKKKALKESLSQAKKQAAIFKGSTEDLEKGLHKSFQELAGITKNMRRAEKSSQVMSAYLEKGAKEFSSTVTDAAEGFGSKLMGSIDSGQIARSLGATLGKSIGGLGDKMGGAFKLALGPIGAVIGMLGAFAGAMLDTDKRIKEFNRTTVKTFGALSLANVGMRDLTGRGDNLAKGLRIVNHAVTDLIRNYGVNQEEATALFDTLDRGGVTLDRLTRGTTNAAGAQHALSNSLVKLYRVANATGVGLTEYADNLTNYVNDLGMSLDGVNDSFAQIADLASQSAFGTRRFYSMVVQATAGQSSLNTQLEGTADLLMRMTKILGAKKATEMTATAGARMGQMDDPTRLRTALIAGEGGRRIMRRGVEGQAHSLVTSARGGRGTAGLTNTLKGIGGGRELVHAIEANDPAALIRVLESTSARSSQEIVSALQNSTDENEQGLGRRLDQLRLAAVGTRRGSDVGQRAAAFGAMGPGEDIAMTLRTLRRGNVGFGQQTGAQRMGSAAMAGIGTGAEADTYAAMDRSMQGGFDRMLDAARSHDTTQNDAFTRAFNASVNSSGQIISRTTGQVIDNIDAFTQNNASALQDAMGDTMSRQDVLAQQTMEATTNISDVIENKLLYYVRALYENVGEPIIRWIGKQMDPTGEARRKAATDAREGIRTQMETETSGSSARAQTIRERQATLHTGRDAQGHALTLEQRAGLSNEISGLQAQQEQSRTRQTALMDAGRGLATGDLPVSRQVFRTSDGRTFNSQQEADAAAAATNAARRAARRQEEGPMGMGPAGEGGSRAFAAGRAISDPDVTSSHEEQVLSGTDILSGITAQADATNDQHNQVRRDTKNLERRQRLHLDGVLTGPKLGDALGNSSAPLDFARAQTSEQLRQELVASGMNMGDISRVMERGTLEGTSAAGNVHLQGLMDLVNNPATVAPQAHDFVYQNGGGRPIITPIDREDQVVGSKPGGPIARAGGGGGNVHVNIYGGDERRVYDVVRRVLQQSGIQPNRVGSNA